MKDSAPDRFSFGGETYPFENEDESESFSHCYAEACSLFQSKAWDSARQALLRMDDRWPYNPDVLGRLGLVHSYLQQWAEAVNCLAKATQLSPWSELASISLFLTLQEAAHTLQDDDYREQALDEASRFLLATGRPSVEYGYILKEMRGELTDEGLEAHLENIRLRRSHLEKPYIPSR